MHRILAVLITTFIFIIPIETGLSFQYHHTNDKVIDFYHDITAVRTLEEDLVVIPDIHPLFGLLGSSIACWYNTTNTSGVIPLLVQEGGILQPRQKIYINKYLKDEGSLLILGTPLNTSYPATEILGTPSVVALQAASHVYSTASTIMIISNQSKDYPLSLTAGPLASYLNIPILIYDNNTADLQTLCSILNTTTALVIGNLSLELQQVTMISMPTRDEIHQLTLEIIKDKFGGINYLTLTNPADVIRPQITQALHTTVTRHLTNTQITLLSKKINIKGNDTTEYNFTVPDGITRIQINGTIMKPIHPICPIQPVLFLTLYDPNDAIIAYGSSFAYDLGATRLQTLTCNASGDYRLVIRIYHGIRGGYFIQRGISRVDSDIVVNLTIESLESPHLPLIPRLSMMASYLSAAHGGIIIADEEFELTDNGYTEAAQGLATGPWYTSQLHPYNNNKVNYTINQLTHTLELLEDQELLEDYFTGPAWLAILADTTMIPMYYYGPSQSGLVEQGFPSDNPYSLQWNLSVGRLIGWNIYDVSLIICQTLFYEQICGKPEDSHDWHHRFSFIFGEGFGETGGFFHQIPYAKEIREYGFSSKVYGDFRNSRQITALLKVYTGSNYIEYLGHGDWFWYLPSLYGLDYYSKAVDVAHAKEWIYDLPSVFLSSACLMGRVDGIPPEMNIGLTMLHAGCNSFIGATRETGSEAGLEPLENHLIVDNWSIGEALRGEKRIDQDLPTYYVRVLYGDPAFNPYEPNNGFSTQGRPIEI
jgi:hypothetical protein